MGVVRMVGIRIGIFALFALIGILGILRCVGIAYERHPESSADFRQRVTAADDSRLHRIDQQAADWLEQRRAAGRAGLVDAHHHIARRPEPAAFEHTLDTGLAVNSVDTT